MIKMTKKTKMMICPRSFIHIPNWKGTKPRSEQEHLSDTFYDREWVKANNEKHAHYLNQEVEFESVILGLGWQCPICNYVVLVSDEEKNKIFIGALSKEIKKNLNKAGFSEVANKLDVERLYYEPETALKEVI